MTWPRLLFYAIILGVAYCEENDIPLGPLIWHSLTTFFLKTSNLMWNASAFTHGQYRKAIESNA